MTLAERRRTAETPSVDVTQTDITSEPAYDGRAVTTEQRTPRKADRRRRRERKTGPIELMIIDGHRLQRAGVRTMVETDNDVSVVAEADSVAEAVDMALASPPDVVLPDVDAADAD